MNLNELYKKMADLDSLKKQLEKAQEEIADLKNNQYDPKEVQHLKNTRLSREQTLALMKDKVQPAIDTLNDLIVSHNVLRDQVGSTFVGSAEVWEALETRVKELEDKDSDDFDDELKQCRGRLDDLETYRAFDRDEALNFEKQLSMLEELASTLDEKLDAQNDALEEQIEETKDELEEQLDDVKTELEESIDDLESRVSTLEKQSEGCNESEVEDIVDSKLEDFEENIKDWALLELWSSEDFDADELMTNVEELKETTETLTSTIEQLKSLVELVTEKEVLSSSDVEELVEDAKAEWEEELENTKEEFSENVTHLNNKLTTSMFINETSLKSAFKAINENKDEIVKLKGHVEQLQCISRDNSRKLRGTDSVDNVTLDSVDWELRDKRFKDRTYYFMNGVDSVPRSAIKKVKVVKGKKKKKVAPESPQTWGRIFGSFIVPCLALLGVAGFLGSPMWLAAAVGVILVAGTWRLGKDIAYNVEEAKPDMYKVYVDDGVIKGWILSKKDVTEPTSQILLRND